MASPSLCQRESGRSHRFVRRTGLAQVILKQVFGDVLGYTKLEYGHVRIECATFSLKQLLDTLDQEMAALRAAIDAKDRDAIARRAHRLRSHADLVNGVALNAAAQKLVLAARSDFPDAWQACIRAVFNKAASHKSAIVRLAAETPRATQIPLKHACSSRRQETGDARHNADDPRRLDFGKTLG